MKKRVDQASQDLKKRVEQESQQRALNLNKDIGDRESLINNAKGIDQALQEANESLRYYESAQKSGVEFDEEDIQFKRKVEESITDLEQQKLRIDENINNISSAPDIFNKLLDDALTENDRIDTKQKEEKARKEFEPRIDNIAQEIKKLSDNEMEKSKLLDEAWNVLPDKKDKIFKMVKEAKKGFDSDYKFREGIDDAVKASFKAEAQIVQTLKEKLGEIRKELRWRDGKKKNAIDHILSKHADEFVQYEKSLKDYLKLKEDNKLEKEKERVADEYGKIIEEARKVQDEIDKKRNNLPASLILRLDNQINKLANITHYDESGKEEKCYGSWNSNENRVFREMRKDITERSGADYKSLSLKREPRK